MVKAILRLTKKYQGNWDKIYEAISSKEKIEIDLNAPDIKEKYIFIGDDNYPNKLKEILVPPFFLFYEGNHKLIEKEVISIHGDVSYDEFSQLLNKSNFAKYVLCINNDDLREEIYNLVIKRNLEIIVLCEGGISKFKYFKDYKNLLLVSEYNDPINYKKSPEQTIERLIYAFSNKIYINKIDTIKTKDLLINQKQVSKDLYCKDILKNEFNNLNLSNINMSYLQNIQDIV